MSAELASAEVTAFLFGGRAHFSLESVASGVSYSYRIEASRDGRVFFAKAAIGGEYAYLGVIPGNRRDTLKATAKTALGPGSVHFDGLAWFLRHREALAERGSEAVRVHHHGQCGRCGRALTDPESIRTGLGPVCRDRA